MPKKRKCNKYIPTGKIKKQDIFHETNTHKITKSQRGRKNNNK